METEAAPPATLDEALADISLRFLANLPPGEQTTVERLFMQIQQAHWYYEDFYVDELGHIPHLGGGDFARLLFERCPLLWAYKYDRAFMGAFKAYLHAIPVCGAVMLNASLTHVLLVRSYKGSSWTFPRGKVNQGEPLVDCAAREAEEETGYNPRALLHPDRYLVSASGGSSGQSVTLFLAAGAPDDGSVVYAPLARKEVSEVAWWAVDDIPCATGQPGASRFWAVREFLPAVKTWIREARASSGARDSLVERNRAYAAGGGGGNGGGSKGRPPSNGKGTPKPGGGGGKSGGGGGKPARSNSSNSLSGASSPALVGGSAATGSWVDDLLAPLEGGAGGGGGKGAAGIAPTYGGASAAATGGSKGWSVADMFKTNEALLGVRFVYDGNPHTFGDARVQAVPLGAPAPAPAAAAAAGASTAVATAAAAPAVTIAARPPAGAKASPAPTPGGGSSDVAAAGGGKKKGKKGGADSAAATPVAAAAAATPAASPAAGGGKKAKAAAAAATTAGGSGTPKPAAAAARPTVAVSTPVASSPLTPAAALQQQPQTPSVHEVTASLRSLLMLGGGGGGGAGTPVAAPAPATAGAATPAATAGATAPPAASPSTATAASAELRALVFGGGKGAGGAAATPKPAAPVAATPAAATPKPAAAAAAAVTPRPDAATPGAPAAAGVPGGGAFSLDRAALFQALGLKLPAGGSGGAGVTLPSS